MTAIEAKQNGLCDEIRESINVNIPSKQAFSTIINKIDAWKQGSVILNQLLPNNNKMIQITNILGLGTEANETAIVNSITELKNQVTNYGELARKYDEIQAEYNAMMAKCNEMESQLNALAKEKEEMENKSKMAEATNVVTKFAELGKISNEASTIELWTNNALKLGVEEITKMLEDLPVNKMAPTGIQNTPANTTNVATTVDEYKNKFKTKA
jgi:seryl-tRNA synthetase